MVVHEVCVRVYSVNVTAAKNHDLGSTETTCSFLQSVQSTLELATAWERGIPGQILLCWALSLPPADGITLLHLRD